MRQLPPISNDPPNQPETPRDESFAIKETKPGEKISGYQLPWWETAWYRNTSSVILSVILHLTVLVLLTLTITFERPRSLFEGASSSPADAPPELHTTATSKSLTPPSLRDKQTGEVVFIPIPEVKVNDVDQVDSSVSMSAAPVNPIGVHTSDLTQKTNIGLQDMYKGRGKGERGTRAITGGGTPDSEAAVERGLRWLVSQQHDDGSWSFNIPENSDRPAYANQGTEPNRVAATAMAILPFLGAGYTHLGGKYQDTVYKGLYYLMKQVKTSPYGADLRGSGDQNSGMYAQGLATIALCEAAAMTGDKTYRNLAQDAIRFVVYAQNKPGGGWRYTPGEPGDTTVTGWQLMALKSAQVLRLSYPSTTLFLAAKFLDSVQVDNGAQYGYQTPVPKRSTTAIGLLCRMYSGWPRSRPALKKGVELLSKWGPSPTDLYYDYYATQVLNHWGGPEWKKWNETMRDYLVKTQSRQGIESGSWYFSNAKGDKGGRLYNTAMAIMILEVYYRYMPLYRSPVK